MIRMVRVYVDCAREEIPQIKNIHKMSVLPHGSVLGRRYSQSIEYQYSQPFF